MNWNSPNTAPKDEGVEFIGLLFGGDVARLKWWSDSEGDYWYCPQTQERFYEHDILGWIVFPGGLE